MPRPRSKSELSGTDTLIMEREPETTMALGDPLFVNECRIELPVNDIIDEIQFERFLILDVIYGDLNKPPILSIADRLSSLSKSSAASTKTRSPSNTSNRATSTSASSRSRGGRGVAAAASSTLGTTEEIPYSSTNSALMDLSSKIPLAKLSALLERAASTQPSEPLNHLQLAFYMPFVQQWKLGAYSRGRLVNSFTLAPHEEQIVELYTWDRNRTGLESSMSFETDQSSQSSNTRRDTSDISSDLTRQSSFELTTDGKVGFQIGVVKADMTAEATAKVGLTEAEKSTRNAIVEATSQSSNNVRSSRNLNVTESHEYGKELRVTRTLKNPNTCHTLTIPFFEILANYHVKTSVRPDGIRLVVLIPSAVLSDLTRFDRASVRDHETSLRMALLDRSLDPGFAAARLLDSRERACALLCSGCDCPDQAPSSEASGTEWDIVAEASRKMSAAAQGYRNDPVTFPASLPGALLNDAQALRDLKRYIFLKIVSVVHPGLLEQIDAVAVPAASAPSQSQVRQLASIAASISGSMDKLRTNQTAGSAVYGEMYVAFLLTLGDPVAAWLSSNIVKANAGGSLDSGDDNGLLDETVAFIAANEAWLQKQAGDAAKNSKLVELARIERMERGVRLLETFGLEASSDAAERLDALLNHLNDSSNLDHYRFAVWNERGAGSDPFVQTLAMAGYIDPTPVGIVGEALAVPVRLDYNSQLRGFFDRSVSGLANQAPSDDKHYILPTGSLMAEGIVGACAACEPSVRQVEELALERTRLVNSWLEMEIKRLQARLASKPPILGPDRKREPAISIRLEEDKHSIGEELDENLEDAGEFLRKHFWKRGTRHSEQRPGDSGP